MNESAIDMFDLKKYYQRKNDAVKESYDNTLSLIREICSQTAFKNAGEKTEYFKFFHHTGHFILQMADNESRWEPDYFLSKDFAVLLNENHQLFEELLPENYQHSYANPAYSVEVFGLEIGQLFSYL